MQSKTIQQPLSGVYAAACTPMHKDYSCNYEALAEHCNDLIQRGCNGILLCGTTGEGSSFSVNERKKIFKRAIELGLNPQKTIMVVNCCAIDDAVTLSLVALELKSAAILIAPPFFYKNVSDAGVIAFYKKVIQEIDHPDLKILLYHIPQLSGVPITVNVIKALREEFPGRVIGLKESEGNLPLTKEILSSFPDFRVFVGHEVQISEAIQLGAAGGISGLANAYPELISSLYAYGKDQKQPNNNEQFQSIVKAVKEYPIFPAIKNLIEKQKGPAWHIVRPPLVPLNEKQSHALGEAIEIERQLNVDNI